MHFLLSVVFLVLATAASCRATSPRALHDASADDPAPLDGHADGLQSAGEASQIDPSVLDPKGKGKGKQVVNAMQHPEGTPVTFRPTVEQTPRYPEWWFPYRVKYAPFPFRPVWKKMRVPRYPGSTMFEATLTRGRIRLYIKRVQALDAARKRVLHDYGGSLFREEAQRLVQPFHPWGDEDLEKVMESLEEYTSLIDAEKLLVNEVEEILDRVATRMAWSARVLSQMGSVG